MATNLVEVKIKSSYKGVPYLRMPAAQMTPDAAASLAKVVAELEAAGGLVRVSDMFRTRAQQVAAHNDWRTGRKKAYSPPAGGSMHEAGRAIDLDLAVLIHAPSVPTGFKVFAQDEMRAYFTNHGWTWISRSGNQHQIDVLEEWHCDFRGPFDSVYKSTLTRTGSHSKAYHDMAAAAIADLAIYQKPAAPVSNNAAKNVAAQPMLIRLGYLTEKQAKGGDGPLTQGSIRTFQSEHNLTVTGVADGLTMSALLAAVTSLNR